MNGRTGETEAGIRLINRMTNELIDVIDGLPDREQASKILSEVIYKILTASRLVRSVAEEIGTLRLIEEQVLSDIKGLAELMARQEKGGPYID